MADETLQLFYDGAWHDAPLSPRSPVTIVRGRGPEQDQPSPSTATATVDNFTGIYNPNNAASPLYGKAGRYTPVRVVRKLVADTFTRTLSGDWGDTDTGQEWVTAGGSGSDYEVDGDEGTMSLGSINVSRRATIPLDELTFTDGELVAGPMTCPVRPTGDDCELTIMFRYQDATNYYQASAYLDQDDARIGLRIVKRKAGNVTALAGEINASFEQGTSSTSLWCRVQVEGKVFRARWWADGDDEPLTWDLVATDDEWASGQVGLRANLQALNTNDLPVVVRFGSFTVYDVRHAGEVASWEPDRTGDFVPNTRGDAWTGIIAAGILRRLNQGAPPVLSALPPAIVSTDPDAYWPMDDGANATRFASGLLGGAPMTISAFGGVDLAGSGDGLPGSKPLPITAKGPAATQADGIEAIGMVPGTVGSSDWTIAFWMRLVVLSNDSTSLNNTTAAAVLIVDSTNPSADQWELNVFYDPGTGSDTFDFVLEPNTAPISETLAHSDDWRHIRIRVRTTGSSNIHQIWVDGTSIGSATESSSPVSASPVRARLTIGSTDPDTISVSAGHLAIWNGNVDPWNDVRDAAAGYPGETAGDRFTRICTKAGVTGTLLGDAGDTPAMGPQQPGTLADLLAEIERTDVGVLYEPRGHLGLVYRTRRDFYNQTAALTLDWNDGRMAPLRPALDDRYTRNDVTVRRRDGSSTRAVQETGPLNVQPAGKDPDGVGRVATEIEVNTETDVALHGLAHWYLHLGTINEPRWPQVTVDIDLYTDVAADVATVNVGDRITIVNVPPDLGVGDIDLLVVGYMETIRPRRRMVTFNCVPASPYDVAVYGTDRYGASDSVLFGATSSSTDPTLSVNTPSGALWTHDDGDFDIEVGGERMTVTAISGTSNPQTFTVIRSVNGVVKSHPAGTPVRLWKEARYAL